MPGSAGKIRAAAEEIYGAGARPEAVILTHGHYDHVGGLTSLLDHWNVLVYAHPLERPYLQGEVAYPPPDPTVGGAMAFLGRFVPSAILKTDVGNRLRALPESGNLPFMPSWEWIFTPGHTPGHVSFFRRSDKTLIAGDAIITVNVDSWADLLTQKPKLYRPPTYYTCDWSAARNSAATLAGLTPTTVATGHGTPMSGPDIAASLRAFVENFPLPTHGRYVPLPAVTDATGIKSLPPGVPDPMRGVLTGIGITAVASLAFLAVKSARRRNEYDDDD